MRTDLAELLTPAGRPELGFHQGTVTAWDSDTGENAVRVNGTELLNVPILNTAEVVALEVGEVVGLLRVAGAFFILGRVVVPGFGPVASSVLSTSMAFGEDDAITHTDVWTHYGGGPGAVVPVPAGFTQCHFLALVNAGQTFDGVEGNLSVQPTVDHPAGRLVGPAVNSGSNAISVATSFWGSNLVQLTEGWPLAFGLNAIRVGAPVAGAGNWHLSASVIFTRSTTPPV